MIKAKNGRCKIKTKGVPVMMAEFSGVCKAVYETLRENGLSKEDACEYMQHNLNLAFFDSEEELREYMRESIMNLIKRQAEGEDHE